MNKIFLTTCKYSFLALALLGLSSERANALEYSIQTYSSGQYLGLDLADMTGDGKMELLAGSWSGNHVEIWAYDQTTEALVLIDDIRGFPGNTISIRAEDFDKDGDKDVAVGLRGAGLWYATNNGPGGWNIRPIDPVYCWKVVIADFDQDSNLDIFDGANGPPFIRLFYGDGTGNFTNPGRYFPSTALARGFNAVDLNGDGQLDLIGTGAFYLRAFLNPGNRLTNWQSIGPAAPFATQGTDELVTNLTPSAADLDGNGVIDQVAYLHSFVANSRDLIVFDGNLSNGTYSWTKRVIGTVPATAAFGSAGVSDLNDDGNLDVHFSASGPTSVNGMTAYLGDGLGNFTLEPIVDSNTGNVLDHGLGGQESVVTHDINGDGTTDIIADRWVNGPAGFEVLYRVPTQIDVVIDIKPGSYPNAVNLESKGLIPVAVLTSESFDVTAVDPATVKFGKGAALPAHGNGHYEDVDNDGDTDLVFHFSTRETGVACGDTSATLTGRTYDGLQIIGTDSIVTKGCR